MIGGCSGLALAILALAAASPLAAAQDSARGQAGLAEDSEAHTDPVDATDDKAPLLELNRGRLSISEVVQYYEVSGDTLAAVREDINRQRLKVNADGRFDAYTRWWINWSITHGETADGCAVKDANVTVTLTITMPRISTTAPAPVRERFDRYWANLMAHETLHADNGRDVGRDISAGLVRLPAERDCASLNASAQEFAQQLIKRGNQNDIEIDRTTRHGATQGAIFP